MGEPADRDEVLRLFGAIRQRFPELSTELTSDDPNVDVLMVVPKQESLPFEVSLYLDGDELHLVAGHFLLEWFPCGREDVRLAYREAVEGLLSGSYRIVEHYVGQKAVRARLEKPIGTGWEKVGSWGRLAGIVPWPSRKEILKR